MAICLWHATPEHARRRRPSPHLDGRGQYSASTTQRPPRAPTTLEQQAPCSPLSHRFDGRGQGEGFWPRSSPLFPLKRQPRQRAPPARANTRRSRLLSHRFDGRGQGEGYWPRSSLLLPLSSLFSAPTPQSRGLQPARGTLCARAARPQRTPKSALPKII